MDGDTFFKVFVVWPFLLIKWGFPVFVIGYGVSWLIG
jgi:hypothetical protein